MFGTKYKHTFASCLYYLFKDNLCTGMFHLGAIVILLAHISSCGGIHVIFPNHTKTAYTHRSSFSEFAFKYSKDERFKSVEKMREREQLFTLWGLNIHIV